MKSVSAFLCLIRLSIWVIIELYLFCSTQDDISKDFLFFWECKCAYNCRSISILWQTFFLPGCVNDKRYVAKSDDFDVAVNNMLQLFCIEESAVRLDIDSSSIRFKYNCHITYFCKGLWPLYKTNMCYRKTRLS